ncbi:MAG: tetratricopeptide repeat protein [Acetobacteraceae bacterium]
MAISERDAVERFLALREQVRQRGLSPDVEAIADWLPHVGDRRMAAEMAKLLGFYWLRHGNPRRAVELSDRALLGRPDDADAAYNAIFALFQLRRWDDVVARARQALAQHPEHFEFCNILSTTLGFLGRTEEARGFGTRSLELKDATARQAPCDLSAVPVPPFDAGDPRRNVIAFSLFGGDPRYTDGAVLNARAARFLYPGWTCRFYTDDSVPRDVVQVLVDEGAQVMAVGGLPAEPYGTMWRFLVAADPDVARYVVRDADSVVNTREKVAVDEWLESDRHFHLMRDHYDHSEVVLAGMWGGVRGALPPLLPMMRAWVANPRYVLGKTSDQEFLRECVWPTVRQSVLAHDSQFGFGETRDFPTVGRLPAGFWVGCDGRRLFGERLAGARLVGRRSA